MLDDYEFVSKFDVDGGVFILWLNAAGCPVVTIDNGEKIVTINKKQNIPDDRLAFIYETLKSKHLGCELVCDKFVV